MPTRRPKVPRAGSPADVVVSGSGTSGEGFHGDIHQLLPERNHETEHLSVLVEEEAPSRHEYSGAEDRLKKRTKATHETALPKPIPAKAFSGRLVALVVVLIVASILLAPTVRTYLDQRYEISALEQEVVQQRVTQDALNHQIARWNDPEYIKQQARDRIYMVMPGETSYLMIGGNAEHVQPDQNKQLGSTVNPQALPWADAVWSSIERSATE